VAPVAHRDLKATAKSYPYLTRGLWLSTLVDAAVHRAWMTILGRREARDRLAHFFCELRDRLGSMSMMKEGSDGLPIAQEELGDAFRMSTVHVNRVVQGMRADGLISTRGKNLDRQRLATPSAGRAVQP
jgi:CRP-like cAMP-binding protein